ncbi:MAG: hypothetical protein QW666_01475 [Candidatus Woesearchaeota archaeon]
MAGFGEISKEKNSFDSYKRNQWMCISVGNQNMYYGKLSKIDNKTEELVFSKVTRYVFNDKGYVYAISDEPMTFQLKAITQHSRATEQEVQQSIENQSIFYNYVGKIVALPCEGTTYLGKLHKIQREHIKLLPYINFSCDEAYIERDVPLSLSASRITQVIPKKEGELEHRLKQILEQKAKENAKSQMPASQEKKTELPPGFGT